MGLLAFIFALIKRFVPTDPVELPKIREEAQNWYDSIRIDKEVKEKGIKYYVKLYSEKWYVKLIFAGIFIYSVKAIKDFMADDEDDEK
jgi:hypothetical protein